MLMNECQFRSVAGGLTDFVVASAITGFFTPEQATNPAVADGALYRWRAESDDLSQHELFEGAYNSATYTVARTTILQSSNAGAKVNFSAAPRVRQVALAQDFRELVTATRNYYVRKDGNDSNNGLADTSAGAFLTIGRAVLAVTREITIAPTCANVIINVRDGVYDEFVQLTSFVGAPSSGAGCTLLGQSKAGTIIRPTTAQPFSNAAVVQVTAPWSVTTLDIDATSSSSGFVSPVVVTTAIMVLGTCRLGAKAAQFVQCDRSGHISLAGAIDLYASGAVSVGIFAQRGGLLRSTAAFTFVGSPTVTTFAFANLHGLAFFQSGSSRTGTVTTTTDANASRKSIVLDEASMFDKTKVTVDATSIFHGAFGIRTKAGAVVAGDLAPGTYQLIHDTSGSTFKLCANIGGVLKTVDLV